MRSNVASKQPSWMLDSKLACAPLVLALAAGACSQSASPNVVANGGAGAIPSSGAGASGTAPASGGAAGSLANAGAAGAVTGAAGSSSGAGGSSGANGAGGASGGNGGMTSTPQPVTPPYTGKPFIEDWKALSPDPAIPDRAEWLTGPGDPVSITVNDAMTLSKISPHLTAQTAPTYNPTAFYTDPAVTAHLADIKMPLVRYPGGSEADVYHWDGVYPYPAGDTFKGGFEWHDFVSWLEKTGAQAVLGVNYAYVHYGSLDAATKLAANWVEYCNAKDDGTHPMAHQRVLDGYPQPIGVKYWEIGNEAFGNWEGKLPAPAAGTADPKAYGYETSGEEYATNFKAFYDAMTAVDPHIYLGMVTDPTGDCCNQPQASEQAIEAAYDSTRNIGDVAGFFIDHKYFVNNPGPTDTLFGYLSQMQSAVSYYDGFIPTHTKKPASALPLALTEYNSSITFTQGMQPNQLVGALFVGELLGMMAEQQWSMGAYWDIANGWNDVNGAVGTSVTADHGFLARFQTQDAVPDGTPHSQYYPFYIWAHAFGDTLVQSSSSDASNVRVFASKFSASKGIGLLVANQGGSARTASIDLGTFSGAGDVNAWVIAGGSLFDTKFTFNGAAGPGPYSGPDPRATNAKPYYTKLVAGQKLAVTIPAYSLVGLVVH
jgi:hypothetical protein